MEAGLEIDRWVSTYKERSFTWLATNKTLNIYFIMNKNENSVIRKISQIGDIFLLIHIMRNVNKLRRWWTDKWRGQNFNWVWEATKVLPHERGTQMSLQTTEASTEKMFEFNCSFWRNAAAENVLGHKRQPSQLKRARLLPAKQATKTLPHKEYHRVTNTKNMSVPPKELVFVLIFIFNKLSSSGLKWNEGS